MGNEQSKHGSKKKYKRVPRYRADYLTKGPTEIPARSSIAVPVHKGESIKIINTHGQQVVAAWALAYRYDHTAKKSRTRRPEAARMHMNDDLHAPELSNEAVEATQEYMSLSHTRSKLGKLVPQVSDTLVDQKRSPILRFVEDTSPGVHDTLSPACDRWQYAELGSRLMYHKSCCDNYWKALSHLQIYNRAENDWKNDKELQVAVNEFCSNINVLPDPIHLFGNVDLESGPQISGVRLRVRPPESSPGEYVRLEALRDVVVVLSACPQNLLVTNGRKRQPHRVFYEVLPRGYAGLSVSPTMTRRDDPESQEVKQARPNVEQGPP